MTRNCRRSRRQAEWPRKALDEQSAARGNIIQTIDADGKPIANIAERPAKQVLDRNLSAGPPPIVELPRVGAPLVDEHPGHARDARATLNRVPPAKPRKTRPNKGRPVLPPTAIGANCALAYGRAWPIRPSRRTMAPQPHG